MNAARVAVFGLGGVGGYVAEALARSGVGSLDLIDADVVTETNINRQIIALTSTLGKPKAEVMRERILDIRSNDALLEKVAREGAAKARESAAKTLNEVREIIGFKKYI